VTREKILIIDGHPDTESFVSALASSYRKGAVSSGAEVRDIVIRDLEFDPNLRHGYRKRTELEPDLLAAQESLRWAEHIVIVHPVWWGVYPALMKGFLDRVLLPGFFFKKNDDGSTTGLLKGKSGHIIYTHDTPGILWLLAGRPSFNALKWITLNYCGVSPVRGTCFSIMRESTEQQRGKWLQKVERLGARRA
jgi:NAD(P)H dehydrogenase (quinone)